MAAAHLAIPHSVRVWSWHNVIAIIIASFFVLGDLVNIIRRIVFYISLNIPVSLYQEILIYRLLFFVWIAGTYLFAYVMMSRISYEIRDPLKLRIAANWATWGLLLLGAGPFVSLSRLKRARIVRDHYPESLESSFQNSKNNPNKYQSLASTRDLEDERHPTVPAWAWYNRLPMFVIPLFMLSHLLTLYRGFSGTSAELTSGEGLFFSSVFFLWMTTAFVLSFICMSKMSEFVHPLRIRDTAGWATWGNFLFGIGPVVAWVRIKRAERHYYQSPSQITSSNITNEFD